jgi:hypothetical protein
LNRQIRSRAVLRGRRGVGDRMESRAFKAG